MFKQLFFVSSTVVLSLLLYPWGVYAQSAEGGYNNRRTPTVIAISKVLPSVVNLSTEKTVVQSYSPWGASDPFASVLDDFFKSQQERLSKMYSLGSGSIIDPSGLIVTNYHVVHRASQIHVTLYDGRKFTAREIASDVLNDLALLKLENVSLNEAFIPIATACPRDLLLGETVITVGNPYGLDSTISKGVLSAIGRKVTYGGRVIFSDILQTDASVYPGNSGGPLINLNGEMIGINTAIHKEARGIGFAIPLQRIENILAAWMIPERFSNVSLGIIPAIRKCMEGGGEQVYISTVIPESPAWKSGIRENMIIDSVNGRKIDDLLVFSRELFRQKAASKLSFVMESGKSYSVQVEKMEIVDGKKFARKHLGIGVQELTQDLAGVLGYPFDGGLVISDFDRVKTDIQRGDVLVRLEDIPIHSSDDIPKALHDKHYGDSARGVLVSVVKRNGRFVLTKKIVQFKVK